MMAASGLESVVAEEFGALSFELETLMKVTFEGFIDGNEVFLH
jgi:hypothetical protein